MSAPKNPIARSIMAVSTLGSSEVLQKKPGQIWKKGDTIKGGGSAIPLVGLAGASMNAAMPKPKMPGMPIMSPMPVTNPTSSTNIGPAASVRSRRNFSTMLTGPSGLTETAEGIKNVLLGGSSKRLGR